MIPFLCRIGWHRWSKWTFATGKVAVGMTTGQKMNGEYNVQERTCAACGKYIWRFTR